MAGPGAKPAPGAAPRLRADKWLWQARFFKSRALAAEAISAGRCRLNGNPMLKPGHAIAAGDVLTFAQGGRIRMIRVLALGVRRGPAGEAQGLYLDLDAPSASNPGDETSSPLE